jgi:hypothetical protein
MQKKSWYHNFRFKLFAVLCAIVVLASALFVRQPVMARSAATQAEYPSDRNYAFSAISRGPGKLDIFIVRSGEIWMKSWTGSIWTNWSNFGKAPTGENFATVTAVAAGNNRWDIFATPAAGAANNLVWHTYFDGVVTFGWEGLGTAGNATPYGVQAVSTGNGRIDIFTRTTGSSGNAPILWKVRTAAGGWSPSQSGWTTLDSTVQVATFTALAHSSNRIDIFKRSSDNQLRRKYYNGTSWLPTAWGGIPTWGGMSGGLALETPYAVSWGPNRIDVFVRGSDHNVWIDSTDDAGTNWTGWNFLGRGPSTTVDAYAVSAVSWGPNRLDLFTEESAQLYYKAWNGTNWSPGQTDTWQNLGYIPTAGFVYGYPPLPVSWGPNRIDLFVYSVGVVSHKWTNDGVSWGPSQTTWENLGP